MGKILIIVDMQNDFIFPDYALGTNEAVTVFNNLKEKLNNIDKQDTVVMLTKDTHYDDYLLTQEGQKLPVPHCIEGTEGHKIPDDLLEMLYEVDFHVYEKPTFASLYLAEELVMSDLDQEENEIEFCGLCTDICVISNVLLMKAYFPEIKITVDSKCCAGTTPEAHAAALKVMQSCQINII